VNLVPPAVTIGGLGVLALGCGPGHLDRRLRGAGWSLLVVVIGGIGAVSHWILDTSVFHQMASAPAVPPHWAANGVMVAIGVASALIGGIAFSGGTCKANDRRHPDPADLTARARIREAAIRHFAEEGTNVPPSGASPGPPAYRPDCSGTTSGPRRNFARRAMNTWPGYCAASTPGSSVTRRRGRRPPRRPAVSAVYRARPGGRVRHRRADLRGDGDATSSGSRGRRRPPRSPAVDRRIRATLVTAMAAGLPLLHEHVSRAIGTDMFGPKVTGCSPSGCSTSTPTSSSPPKPPPPRKPVSAMRTAAMSYAGK